jgi:ubiquinone/menaquinone biosynthesis C-methylase UbiE
MTQANSKDVWVDVDASADPQICVRFLDAFNATPWLAQHKKRALDVFGARPAGRFLEVGCGTGTDAQTLAQRLAAGQVTGVDPSHTMVRAAAARVEGTALCIEFQAASAYALPFADHSFDGVCSLMTFDILEHPLQALREMVRVAKPGGTVMVSASDHGSFVIDAPDRRLTRMLVEGFCDGTHSGWVGRQLPAYFARCGLQEQQVTPDTVMLRAADYAVARAIVLDNMVGAAMAQGTVSAEQGRQWLAALDAEQAAGRFFAASTFFIVSGVKPMSVTSIHPS